MSINRSDETKTGTVSQVSFRNAILFPAEMIGVAELPLALKTSQRSSAARVGRIRRPRMLPQRPSGSSAMHQSVSVAAPFRTEISVPHNPLTNSEREAALPVGYKKTECTLWANSSELAQAP